MLRQAIITMIIFPPNESLCNLVNFESRYVRIRSFLSKELLQLESKESLYSTHSKNGLDLNHQTMFKIEGNILFVFAPALDYSTQNKKYYIFDKIFPKNLQTLNYLKFY